MACGVRARLNRIPGHFSSTWQRVRCRRAGGDALPAHRWLVLKRPVTHSFATDALINGVGIAQVAELLGHTSTEMVMRHYSHIAGKIDHMGALR